MKMLVRRWVSEGLEVEVWRVSEVAAVVCLVKETLCCWSTSGRQERTCDLGCQQPGSCPDSAA